MTKIVVFGAGGRAGRAIVREAERRGLAVTAVVREPARHGGLSAISGDVTDARSVARCAAGHDAAVHAAADLTVPAGTFFPAAATALRDGLAEARVRRLVMIGVAPALPTAGGTPLAETPAFPDEHREFSRGHGAGTGVLRNSPGGLDWVTLSPAGDFDHGGTDTGGYQSAQVDMDSRITYADFALAVIDQIEHPTLHRVHAGFGGHAPV